MMKQAMRATTMKAWLTHLAEAKHFPHALQLSCGIAPFSKVFVHMFQ
jgi:hypothetical protein